MERRSKWFLVPGALSSGVGGPYSTEHVHPAPDCAGLHAALQLRGDGAVSVGPGEPGRAGHLSAGQAARCDAGREVRAGIGRQYEQLATQRPCAAAQPAMQVPLPAQLAMHMPCSLAQLP